VGEGGVEEEDDLLKLTPGEALGHESPDDIAWALCDIAVTLRSVAEVLDESPRYRTLGTSASRAARAVGELEEKWTKYVIGV